MAILELTDLPRVLRNRLPSIGIHRTVSVVVTESVSVFDPGSSGRRGFAYEIDLATGDWTVTMVGSWGGPNPFVKSPSAVDDSSAPPRAIAPGKCLIVGSEGSDRVHGTVHIHPRTLDDYPEIARALAETEAPCIVHDECRALGTLAKACAAARSTGLTDRMRRILAIHRSLKAGKYRRNALKEAKVTTAEIDALVTSEHLTRNKAGAVTITTKGRNACEAVSPW